VKEETSRAIILSVKMAITVCKIRQNRIPFEDAVEYVHILTERSHLKSGE
jgi:hypothetical protein